MTTAIVDELIAILGYEIKGEADRKRFEKSLNDMGNKVNVFANRVGKAAAAASVAIGGLSAVFGKSVISTSAEFESFKAQLETIEGSSAKAQKSLDWITEFGKTTPFEIGNVTDSFVRLKGAGIDPLADDALRNLGDLAAAKQKPLLQAVEALKDAATFEFERLKEFDISTLTKGEEVIFSWTQNNESMSKSVKKNSKAIRDFLLQLSASQFGGAMEKQSRTWKGLGSNLSDFWEIFQKTVGDKGFFDVAKGYLERLLSTLTELEENGTLDRWAQRISSGLTSMASVFGVIAERIGAHVKFIMSHGEALIPWLKGIGIALGILIIKAFPVVTAIGLIAVGLDDLLMYLQGGESAIGRFVDKLQEMLGVSKSVAEWITGMSASIVSGLGLAFLIAPKKMKGWLWRFVKTISKSLGGLLVGGLISLAPKILAGLGAAFGLISNPVGWAVLIGAAATGLIYYFWDDLKSAWGWLKTKAKSLFGTLADWFVNVDMFQVGIDLVMKLFEGMKSIGSRIKQWFSDLIPDWVKNFTLSDSAKQQMENLHGNVEKTTMGPGLHNLTGSMVNNRMSQGDVNINVPIEQHIKQATDAPEAASRGMQHALTKGIQKRAALEAEPSF